MRVEVRRATARSTARSTSAACHTDAVKSVGAIQWPARARTICASCRTTQIFETIDFDFDVVAQRLREIGLSEQGAVDHADRRARGAIDGELVLLRRRHRSASCATSTTDRERCTTGPSTSSAVDGNTQIEVALQYNDGFSEAVFSFANNINTIDGGTHLTGFRAALTRVAQRLRAQGKILKDNDANLSGDDVREGLTAVISVKLPEPQFEGQTKAKLGNAEVKGQVQTRVPKA